MFGLGSRRVAALDIVKGEGEDSPQKGIPSSQRGRYHMLAWRGRGGEGEKVQYWHREEVLHWHRGEFPCSHHGKSDNYMGTMCSDHFSIKCRIWCLE